MEYKRDYKVKSRKRTTLKYKRHAPICTLVGGIGALCLAIGLYFGTDIFSDPGVDVIALAPDSSQYRKEVILAENSISQQVSDQKQESSQNNGASNGKPMSGDIKGDWSSDSVAGMKVAWTYLCNIYETAGTLATVQEHYGCDCTPDDFDVPRKYSSSSVAFGPFQADSKYAASTYFSALANLGWPEFQAYVGLSNADYMKYETRKALHGLMLKREAESKITFFVNSADAMRASYLPEKQLVALEQTLGKSREDIPDAIIAGMFSCNIYCGANFGNRFIKKINASMSNTEIINTLYDTRKVIKNGDWPRNQNERQLALMMLDSNFNGYAANDIPGKGAVAWGANMGVPGY